MTLKGRRSRAKYSKTDRSTSSKKHNDQWEVSDIESIQMTPTEEEENSGDGNQVLYGHFSIDSSLVVFHFDENDVHRLPAQ